MKLLILFVIFLITAQAKWALRLPRPLPVSYTHLDLNANSKDAVNGSQLYEVKELASKGWNATATKKDGDVYKRQLFYVKQRYL